MSEHRDEELARAIFIIDNRLSQNPARIWDEATADTRYYAYAIAEGLSDIGYAKPRTLESDDQLRAIKVVGTLLRDSEGRVIERVETLPGHLRWYWLSNNIVNSVWPTLPATVLYEPNTEGEAK